jgi:hypothetical protein
MPTLFLAALFASALNPSRAWSDLAAWEAAPRVSLKGSGRSAAAPATVRALWNEEWVFFEFSCHDKSLVSPGRTDGEDHFKIGDVVEVFLGRAGKAAYLEVHATPAGRQSVYAFSGYRKSATPPDGIGVRSAKTDDGWRAVISVPWSSTDGGPRDTWEFLAGRYDYDEPGGRPVLSSFPPQSGKADFHDRDRFARLELRP